MKHLLLVLPHALLLLITRLVGEDLVFVFQVQDPRPSAEREHVVRPVPLLVEIELDELLSVGLLLLVHLRDLLAIE